jgi:hypothetical protein
MRFWWGEGGASQSPHAEQSCRDERRSTAGNGDERAHLHLQQERPQRHQGRRKEQGEDESNSGGAPNHEKFAPADPLREMQPCGDRRLGSRDDAEAVRAR